MFETLERKALELSEALLKALGGSGQREEEVVVEHRGMRTVNERQRDAKPRQA